MAARRNLSCTDAHRACASSQIGRNSTRAGTLSGGYSIHETGLHREPTLWVWSCNVQACTPLCGMAVECCAGRDWRKGLSTCHGRRYLSHSFRAACRSREIKREEGGERHTHKDTDRDINTGGWLAGTAEQWGAASLAASARSFGFEPPICETTQPISRALHQGGRLPGHLFDTITPFLSGCAVRSLPPEAYPEKKFLGRLQTHLGVGRAWKTSGWSSGKKGNCARYFSLLAYPAASTISVEHIIPFPRVLHSLPSSVEETSTGDVPRGVGERGGEEKR